MQHPLQRKAFLTLENPWYREQVKSFFAWQRAADGADLTSDLLIPVEKEATAEIWLKEPGIISGLEEVVFLAEREELVVEYVYSGASSTANCKNNPLNPPWKGDKIHLLTLRGNARKLLLCERIFLNMLSRMSGIATKTASLVQQMPEDVLLAATRKTLWGALDKKAVADGGGATHRLGLFDAVLVKDNHLALGQEKLLDILPKMQVPEGSFWEVEVDTEEQFFAVLEKLTPSLCRKGGLGRDFLESEEQQQIQKDQQSPPSPLFCKEGESSGVIMLDNFSPERITALLQNVKLPEQIFLEASGGITEENYLEYARTGVSAISGSFLTMQAHALDVGMEIINERL